MKSRFVLAGIVSLLLLISFASSITANPQPLVVVYAKGMLEPDSSLQYMMGNITDVKWKLLTESLTYEDLKGAKMLILVLVDTSLNYTTDELDAIKKWFDEGDKTLWVCSDSDYKGGDYLRIEPANNVLEKVGSVLRSEHTEGVDKAAPMGAPYRVGAKIDPDDPLKFLANGVSNLVLFHGPGIVIAYKDGKYMALEENVPENVYRIAWIEEGAVSEFVAPLPEVHDLTYEGKLVEMAAELFPDKKNIVILSAEAPFDHYRGMWTDFYHEVTLDGARFVTNVISWGVSETFWLELKVNSLEKTVSDLSGKVDSLTSQVKTLSDTVNTLSGKVDTLTSDLNNLSSKVNELSNKVSGLAGTVNTALGVAVLSLIIALVAVALPFVKKPATKKE